MMHFLIYIIKSTLCLTLFYLFFKALLSRETFFRFNRFVLLAGMIVCTVLPVIEIKVPRTNAIHEPVARMESLFEAPKTANIEINRDEYFIIKSAIDVSKSVEPDGKTAVPSSTALFPVAKTITTLYVAGFIITLVSLFVSIFKMIRIIRNGTKIRKEKYTVVCIQRQICPFSWRNYIVLNESDYRQNPDEIITHEAIHVRKRHSLDLLFAELFILFHWFNPVAWLLKRELQDVHEYEADKGVVSQGIDATKYQLMLVKKAVGARSYAIANSFNHSKIKIKNRVTMMLKRKSNQWARLKLLLFAPLAVVLLQAFARPETVRIQESLISSEGTTIFEEPKQPESKSDVQAKEKSSKVEKKEFILRNDSLGKSKLNVEPSKKAIDIVTECDSDLTKKVTIKVSTVIVGGDRNGIVLNGDSSVSSPITFERSFSFDPKQLEEMAKQGNGNLGKLFDKNFLSKIDSLKLSFNIDSLNFNLDSLKMQELPIDPKEWEEFKQQAGELRAYFNSDEWKDFIKQTKAIQMNFNFDSLKMNLKNLKINQKQTEELQKQMEELQKQTEELQKQ